MGFRVKIAEEARRQLNQLPSSTAYQLGARLQEIAELADLRPLLYAGDTILPMHLKLDGVMIQYALDPREQVLTVTGIAPRSSLAVP